ncbi:type 1 fimbrial protein [Salmonella enterica]|nr:type 1 fimbrial protein [Salmonella enterica]
MKIKNRLFLLGAAMAVMSSSAFAATTGTQTFTANVTADTCTITGLNETVTLPAYSRQDLTNAGHDKHSLPGQFTQTFNVSGCPASVTKMTTQLNYTQAAAPTGKPVPALTGTGKGVALWLYTPKGYFMSGNKYESTISNGSGSSSVKVVPYGWFPNGNADIVAGTYSTTLNLTFDFT